MPKEVHVAAGVLLRPDGHFLLGQRAPDAIYGGYWEFPGGKVEAGESPRQALIRELHEELQIEVQTCWPWLLREHEYEHAHVHLHFFIVPDWKGEFHTNVHAALTWQPPGTGAVSPMLPANTPILKALSLPRRMAITQAGKVGVATQLAMLDAALARGLRCVQVREPMLEAGERNAFARACVQRCQAAGALCIVNGDAALARECGADGVHLPARQLLHSRTRPDFTWVGASCHDRTELQHAAALGLDYALLGSVLPTASHPGQASLGWDGFAALAADLPLPVLALGGLQAHQLAQAQAHGAHGIAAIRSSWA